MSPPRRRGRSSELSEARKNVEALRPSAAPAPTEEDIPSPEDAEAQAAVDQTPGDEAISDQETVVSESEDEYAEDELAEDELVEDELAEDELTEDELEEEAYAEDELADEDEYAEGEYAEGEYAEGEFVDEDELDDGVVAAEDYEESLADGEAAGALATDGHGADQQLTRAKGGKAARAPKAAKPPKVRKPRKPRRERTGPLHRLYAGQTRFDFVGRKRVWFAVSGVIILAGILSLGIRGFNFGIEFKGGTSWETPAHGVSATQVQDAVQADGVPQPVVEVLGGKTIQVQADLNSLPKAQQLNITRKVTSSLASLTHVSRNTVSISTVGPTWGSQVSQKALEALIAFFIVVAIYISLRFEWKMAVAAIVAVIHDLLITAGVYSLSGLQVTPDTVIAVLTILGYSLYDTVVVFDRVRDNTKSFAASGQMTYSEMVNLSMNQTLARSINTSMVAILPVLSVLVIGAYILGATTLQTFGLALVIGLLSGAYSSIFIASPVLAVLKEREPRYQRIRQRLAAKGDRLGSLTPAAAAVAIAGSGGALTTTPGRPRQPGPPPAEALRPATARGGQKSKAKPARTGGSDDRDGQAVGQPAGVGAGSASTSVGGARSAAGSGSGQGPRRTPSRPRKGGSKSKRGSKRRR